MNQKQILIGYFVKDMKSGVFISDTRSATYKLTDSNNLEFCCIQVSPKLMVTNCLEMVKQ